MDCTQSLVELFCQSFPEIDRRVIKATVLEYGNDVESAINDLIDISGDQIKDTSFIDHLKLQCCSILCPAEDAVEKVNIEEDKSQVVGGFPSTTNHNQFVSPSENKVVDASNLQMDLNSAYSVEDSNSDNNTITEPLATNSTRPETLDSSSDIADVASSLECSVQEVRSDIGDVFYLIKEVSDLRIKTDEERIEAQNAVLEAGRGGEDLLMKACEVNKQTQKLKQDNLKLSLEIHGEKSVLALEAEELKVRLEQMKQQKAKAVTTLHEIRDTLQSSYDTACEERKLAEKDRELKEEKAGKVLEQEEDLMAIIQQETKALKMEAESCTLLRDFLVDHGSIVDALQLEINNLCEDVKYLKEQVQGMKSSVHAASPQEPAQKSAVGSSRSSSTLSVSSVTVMTNSLASQSSGSTLKLDLNCPGTSQFLYSFGTHGPIVSTSFDGTTELGPISSVNSERGFWDNMPMQEPPFMENSYDSQVPGLLSFRNGASHQHHAFGEYGDLTVDSNRVGISHLNSAFGEHGNALNGYHYMQELSNHHRAFSEHGDDSSGYGYSHIPSQQRCTFGEHRDDSNGYGLSHLHFAFNKPGGANIDLNRYGYPHVAWP